MKRRLADATAVDRLPFVDRRFSERVAELDEAPFVARDDQPLLAPHSLQNKQALAIFDAQLYSRHLDFCARELKQQGHGFYTIGSAGHEANAAVAAALRPSDPALLHYRSGAFFMLRAQQAKYDNAALDVLLGVAAAADEPIAGGRHKVFGNASLQIPPQTSTIASHLPKAVGMAFGIARAARLGVDTGLPEDAIVVCSFGDASANHSTATGAINAATWAAHQNAPMPLLFVCEDNGLGISVATPQRWIETAYGSRPGLGYRQADGANIAEVYDAARDAVAHVRRTRKPALLHLRVVRLMGHAGSDVETLYRTPESIERSEEQDPLIASARLLVAAGVATPAALIERYERVREEVRALGRQASLRPKLVSAAQVMAPLAPREPKAIAAEVARPLDAPARRAFWDERLPESQPPAPLGVQLNRALGDLLCRYPELLIFGEDVAQKGGVYGITRNLVRRAKRGQVFDTLLDEQTVLGTAIGAAHVGLLPIAEIQYLAYLHNAEDQLRGEAATLQFFSQGQFTNPMVVRIAGYAYQKGFGGHFHNDNSVAVLRDIPGLVIASPSRGDDAAAMLHTCVAAAKACGSVCVFLEPIALYPTRDLYDAGDGAWCTPYDPAPAHVPIGKARLYGSGGDLLIVSWANGLFMSLRVAKQLEDKHGIACRVLDLRWLAPLPVADLLEQAKRVGKVLIVDETRRSGGVSEALITALVEGEFRGPLKRVAAHDSYIPLGDAANLVLVQEQDIERAALSLR
jgi:2-oxoisovalerate dehydrogenase E1 component